MIARFSIFVLGIAAGLILATPAAGQEPVVLDNLASGDRENLPDGAKLVEMDIADAGVVEAIAEPTATPGCAPTCSRTRNWCSRIRSDTRR